MPPRTARHTTLATCPRVKLRASANIYGHAKRDHDYLHCLPAVGRVVGTESAVRVAAYGPSAVDAPDVLVESRAGRHVREVHGANRWGSRSGATWRDGAV